MKKLILAFALVLLTSAIYAQELNSNASYIKKNYPSKKITKYLFYTQNQTNLHWVIHNFHIIASLFPCHCEALSNLLGYCE